MELVPLCAKLEAQFERFYNDFVAHDPSNGEFYAQGMSDFLSYVLELDDHSRGVNLPEDYVPCTTYWLKLDDGELAGAIRIRHNIDNPFLASECGHIGYDVAPSQRRKGYATKMLQLARIKAAELGIDKALVTADLDNIGSRKVIEANDGEFDGIVYSGVFESDIARYWVSCSDSSQ